MPYRREAEIVLAVWREVERGLLAPDLIADDREHLESEAARLRDEYQRLIAEAKLHARPVPPELPVYLIEPQESSRRAQTSGLGGSGLGPSLLLTLASPPHEGT